ncbi:hypothetical protein [Bacillus cereus group sp. MYBK74-2]|uniref:hypothetical protein n=1 Tax=Bacillus cereus group sp. MYBK74-2 TaxID=3450609 RepID=UPI003F7AD188
MVNGVWSNEEIEVLKSFLGQKGYQEISVILGRNVNSIQKKVIALGLSREIKKKPWSEEEIKLLKSLYGITGVEGISKRLNRTHDSITGKAKQLNLKGFVENAWTKNELEFLRDNFKNMTIKDIANSLGRTENAVQLKANRIGLKQPTKYEYDKDYFKIIDCEEKAYWLGFIYADGYVSIYNNGRNHEFGIELKASDDEHLKKFNRSINGNIELSYRTREHKFSKYTSVVDICSIRIYSQRFVSHLIENGVVLNKTYVLDFPNFIPKELMRHFIRGYIDGDGYIRFGKRTSGNGYGYETRFGFTCYSKKFTIGLKKFLENELNLETELVLYKDKSSFSVDTANQKQLLSMLEYLYNNSTVYLDRKHQNYKKIQHYLLNKSAYRKRKQ